MVTNRILSLIAISLPFVSPVHVIAQASEGATPSISMIKAEIQSAGAQATVRDLWRSKSRWDELLSHIQSGDRDWLKVADDLKSGADGGQLETLRIAISESIQKQPENFLSVAWPVFGVDACHDLRIEPTAQQHSDFITNTRRSLNTVTTNRLRSRRDSCLHALSH